MKTINWDTPRSELKAEYRMAKDGDVCISGTSTISMWVQHEDEQMVVTKQDNGLYASNTVVIPDHFIYRYAVPMNLRIIQNVVPSEEMMQAYQDAKAALIKHMEIIKA